MLVCQQPGEINGASGKADSAEASPLTSPWAFEPDGLALERAARERIGERLSQLRKGAEPLVSFRHARIGRIGESGQMPNGWRSEHLKDVEIRAIASLGRPWIEFRVGFGVDIPGQFAGLGLASYFPAPKATTVALAGEITLAEWDNIAEVMLVVREWKHDGYLVAQVTQPLDLVEGPQKLSMSYTMSAEDCVAEPLLMIRRDLVEAGGLTIAFTGLAFGSVEYYTNWRFSAAED